VNAKPIQPKEFVLIALVFPLLGILMGGIYSYPAMRLTKERDPWLTLLLGVGLAITVFGVGYAAHTPPIYLVSVWLVSVLLLLLARAAFGNLGHSFERFGMVHMATLFILFWVLVFTRNATPTSPSSLLKYFQVEERLDRLERRCLSVDEAPQNRRNFG